MLFLTPEHLSIMTRTKQIRRRNSSPDRMSMDADEHDAGPGHVQFWTALQRSAPQDIPATAVNVFKRLTAAEHDAEVTRANFIGVAEHSQELEEQLEKTQLELHSQEFISKNVMNDCMTLHEAIEGNKKKQAAKQLHELQQKDEVKQQLKRRFCDIDISGMGPNEPSLLQLMDIMDAIHQRKRQKTVTWADQATQTELKHLAIDLTGSSDDDSSDGTAKPAICTAPYLRCSSSSMSDDDACSEQSTEDGDGYRHGLNPHRWVQVAQTCD